MAPKAGSTRTAPPAFDFTAVKAVAAPAPARESSVAPQDNPALPWVRESWANKKAGATVAGEATYLGAGRAIVVPTPNASQAATLIRKAAEALAKELGERIGVAIKLDENPKLDTAGNLDEAKGKVTRGMTAVRFAAKTGKRPYTRRGNGNGNGTASS
jgi:hypothetical protein